MCYQNEARPKGDLLTFINYIKPVTVSIDYFDGNSNPES